MNGCLFGNSAVSVRTRCSRMIRETATWLGVLLVSATVLFGLLTGESTQVHALSVLIFGIIPAAAVMALAAMLVCLLRILGSVCDLLRAALVYRVHVRATTQLVKGTMAVLIWTRHFLKRVAEATRNGWAFVVREIVLEVAWAQQVAARLVATMSFVAGWPIRSTARFLLKLIDRRAHTAISPTLQCDRSPNRAVRLEVFGTTLVGEMERRAA
jgi:hypothetical protein